MCHRSLLNIPSSPVQTDYGRLRRATVATQSGARRKLARLKCDRLRVEATAKAKVASELASARRRLKVCGGSTSCL